MTVHRDWAIWLFKLEGLRFGDYTVFHYHLGWRKTIGSSVSGGQQDSVHEARQKYEFRLASGTGQAWNAGCVETASKRTEYEGKLFGGELSSESERRSSLTCDFRSDQGDMTWTLALTLQPKGDRFLSAEMLGGGLTDGRRTLRVRGIDETEGHEGPVNLTSGFAIKDSAKVLCAIQTINTPKVWVDPAADPELRDPLALASTALILRQDLLERLDHGD